MGRVVLRGPFPERKEESHVVLEETRGGRRTEERKGNKDRLSGIPDCVTTCYYSRDSSETV